MDPIWKRFKHLPEGASHAFTAKDETTAACGRSTFNLYPWEEDTNAPKCRNCIYILEGSLVIARMKMRGGMVHQ